MYFKHILFIISIFVLLSCTRKDETGSLQDESKGNKVIGYVVPKDSLVDPQIIVIDQKKLKRSKVGKTRITPFSFNKNDTVNPKVSSIQDPRLIEIGSDTLSLPEFIPAFDFSFLARAPQTTVAKDMFYKDVNSVSIYSFSKLQGLKYSGTRSLLEDRDGNIWFGSNGGGVTRYDGKFFTYYTVKEGLLSNKVSDMLQDQKGNIWFATNKGLCYFNGKKFTYFKGEDCIANNAVLRVIEDNEGNIWFTSTKGLAMYTSDHNKKIKTSDQNVRANEFDSLKSKNHFILFSSKTGILNEYISCIHQDYKGNIWFGTPSGISCYNGKTFCSYTEKEGLANDVVTCIKEDKKGNLWIGTLGGGISRYDGNRIESIQNGDKKYGKDQDDLLKVNGKLVKTFTNYSTSNGLVHNNIFCIQEDSKGNLWIGTQHGGVSKFNGKYFINFTENNGLPNNRIFKIIEDKYDNIWFGTESGVAKIPRESFQHYGKNDQLSNYKFKTTFEDKFGNIWIGTYLNGVLKYDGKTLINYSDTAGLFNIKIFSIVQDRKGNMWFGSFGEGVTNLVDDQFIRYSETDGLPNRFITSITKDRKGNMWFASANGGACCFDGERFINYSKKSGLVSNDVRTIHEDRSGTLWFATLEGITKFDGKNFTHYSTKDGLLVNSILCIYEDEFGHLWFGTDEGGVSFFDGKQFVNYSEAEGLAHHVVTNILEDKFKNVWITTRFGLSKLSKAQVAKISNRKSENTAADFRPLFYNYNFNDGFIGIGCESGGALLTKDGKLWFCSNDRLTVFQPTINLVDTLTPNIKITGIGLYNEQVPWSALEKNKDSTFILTNGVEIRNFEFDSVSKWYNLPENLSLAYDNNFLNFNMIGITMDQPQKVKYQYKLQGLENNWEPITERTNAPYGNLPAGTYTFMVKSVNSKGFWSKELHYVFTIRPPWWKTLLFRIILIGLIIAIIVYYITWRERKLKEHQKELELKINEATLEITEQKQLIEIKHQEIKDSINYAERIQRSFLATKEILDQNLKDYFVFFQPKDIVSGDFYWASFLKNNNFIYVVADSTGHGVPGAIMSVLNISSLEKSIETETEPSMILNATRKIIVDRLKRDGSVDGGKDGMDCSLIILNKERTKLYYSAANNPIWIIRNKEIVELRPDKMPVGKHEKDNLSFTQNEFDLQGDDVIYSITDGFPDQFGGARGKKYLHKKLKEVLLSIAHLSMHEQQHKLKEEFSKWKGDLEQVDDVTIMGVRV